MLAVPPSQREMAPYLQEDFSSITPPCLIPLSCGIEKATFGFFSKEFDFLGGCGIINFVV